MKSKSHFSYRYRTLTLRLRESPSSCLAKDWNHRWPKYQCRVVPQLECSTGCPARPCPPHNCATWSPNYRRYVSAGKSRGVSCVSDHGYSRTRSTFRAASTLSLSTTAQTWQIRLARAWTHHGSCAASRHRCTWKRTAQSDPRSPPGDERSAWETARENAVFLREIVNPLQWGEIKKTGSLRIFPVINRSIAIIYIYRFLYRKKSYSLKFLE